MSNVRVIVKPGGFVVISLMAMVLAVIAVFVIATQPELFHRLTQPKPSPAASTPSVVWAQPATLSASNVFENDATYAASKACDGNTETRWATDSGTKQAWLQADFAPAVKIKGVRLVEAYGNRIQKFEIQYQAPGKAEWFTLESGTHLGENHEFQFPPVQAQSIRLNILDASEGPTISEFYFQAVN